MRHIRLPINATETHCDDCDALDSDVLVCRVFDAEPVWRGGDLARLPECLAAEAADKARERDAALGAAVRAVLPRNAQGDAKERQSSLCDDIASLFEYENKPGPARIYRAIADHLRTEET